MSHREEKAQAVETETAGKSDSATGPVILFFIVGFALSMVIGWVIFPKLLYSQKSQPFSFDHKLHVEQVEEGCDSCHYFRDDGSFSGIPKLESCVECHEEVMGETEDEEIFVTQYVQTGIEVPWLVYSKQPDCVFFSHVAHVKKGKMDCVSCHGHIGESTRSRVYEENRITGYSRDIWGKNIAGFKTNSWDRMKMDDCAACHAGKLGVSKSQPAPTYFGRYFREMAGVAFPGTTNHTEGSSVQTERDACFVCHK
jgi:menaquinone reductase, multiheme cytochrome c subunit